MWWLALAIANVDLVTYTNTGFLDFFLNWHAHYENLGLQYSLTVYALDEPAYRDLRRRGINTIKWNETHEKTSVWNTLAYNKLVHTKPKILLERAGSLATDTILVWFDVDSVWLDDPVPYLGSCRSTTQMDGPDHCTGFMMFRVRPELKPFFQRWIDALHLGYNDQRAFNLVSQILKPCKLPQTTFPSGQPYPHMPSEMVIFHNNYVIGHSRKRDRFKEQKLWLVD